MGIVLIITTIIAFKLLGSVAGWLMVFVTVLSLINATTN